MAEALVQQQFIVAAVNHHGNTAVEPRQWPAGFVLPGERVRDLSLLVDRMLEHPQFGSRVDPERIGAAGFSLGGYTVLATTGTIFTIEAWTARCAEEDSHPACLLPPEAEFSFDDLRVQADQDPAFQAGIERSKDPVIDSRIRAVFAIAPALMTLLGDNDPPALVIPTRVVLAEADRQILADETESVVRRLFPNAEIVRIPKAGHYSFLAPCTFWSGMLVGICRDRGRVDRSELHAQVAADAARFFNQTLNGYH